jgi:hypothetical protein
MPASSARTLAASARPSPSASRIRARAGSAMTAPSAARFVSPSMYPSALTGRCAIRQLSRGESVVELSAVMA